MTQKLILCAIIFVLFGAVSAISQSDNLMSYQGQLTDSSGEPVTDATYWMRFNIYCSAVEIWSSDGHQPVDVLNGLFEYYLGSSNPLPDSIYNCDSLYLGVTIGTDTEMSPRILLSATPYSFRAKLAEKVARSRDLYHEIVDVNPFSTTKLHFVAHYDNPTISLYVYGDQFQSALPEHTHNGLNGHMHTMNGVVLTNNSNHSHPISFTSGSSNASHSHSGSSGVYNLSHTHSSSMSDGGSHKHNLIYEGAGGTGLYLLHYPETTILTHHGAQNTTAIGSVDNAQSPHSHTTNINPWGGNHSHTVTVNSGNATHSHSVSGTSGSNSASHDHDFNGSIDEAGTGLENSGINSTITPSQVYIYVDGTVAAGPFDGEFSSGELDLSPFVSAAGEHLIEIKEEGGSGGRVSYNLFVE